MNIIETNIFDFNKQINNIDEYKINLINKILTELKPLIENKNDNTSILNENIQKTKNELIKDKLLLESLLNELNKKKKIKQLLENINKRIKNKSFINKHETNVLLKVIDTLPIEKLNFYINKLNK